MNKIFLRIAILACLACTPLAATAQTAPRSVSPARLTPTVLAVRAVAPAVVSIATSKVIESRGDPFGGLFQDEFFRRFLGPGFEFPGGPG
ncbi:MAG: hypothetical protein GYA47_03715, partial [Desulfovibrio sp.]|nr:hypothetical protein [Desulfovibrio sp.]